MERKSASNAKLEMKCPHCQHKLTLREAVIILHGSGFAQIATIKLADGTIAFVEAGVVNPNTVEILE